MLDLKLYQEEALDAIRKHPHGQLIYLPPGSGKSIILYKTIEELGGPALIVSFKYVIYQHLADISKFIEFTPVSCKSSKTKLGKIEKNQVLCVTPTIMVSIMPYLLKQNFKVIGFDESHMFKNYAAKRSIAAKLLGRYFHSAKKVCMTATPCPEGLEELHPQIEIIDCRNPMGNAKEFEHRFINKWFNGTYYEKTLVNPEGIKILSKPYIFHREVEMPKQISKDVVLQMPPKLEKIYKKAREECIVELQSERLFITSSPWIKLLQICSGFVIDTNMSKIQGTQICHRLDKDRIDVIKDMAINIEESKIIWCMFREEALWLHEEIKGSSIIIGGCKDGEEILSNFKLGKIKNLIANPTCIGAGISLEMCHLQIFASISASCSLYQQTITRTNRINQQSQEIIYRVFYRKTIQEKLFKLVSLKEMKERELLKEILDDK